jgi:glycine cleavage system aminomethyltransferase T
VRGVTWFENPLGYDGAVRCRVCNALGKQIGMGYVRIDLAEVSTKMQVRMQRQLWDAVVVEDSPFDPSNARIRVDG